MPNTFNRLSRATIEIRNEINRLGITRLCHLTRMENLFPILANNTGILANDRIAPEYLKPNDLCRVDGRPDYISTSIQYPNVWYYNNKKSASGGDWAVISIDPAVCTAENTLFSPVNAAKGCGRYLKPGVEGLRACFAPAVVSGRTRTSLLLANCPTDDQAEVMIYGRIPTEYFQGIAFETEAARQRFISIAQANNISYPDLYVVKDLFNTGLSTIIHSGNRPMGRRFGGWKNGNQTSICG